MKSLALVSAVACIGTLCGCGPVGMAPGAQAPDVWFTPIDRPDASVYLKSLRGKVVLVDFWATWCAPCRETMPVIQRMHEVFASQGLQVVAVSDESKGKVESFLKETPFDYPVFLDRTGLAFRGFQIRELPTCFVIGRDGKIRWKGHAGDVAELKKAIEDGLAE